MTIKIKSPANFTQDSLKEVARKAAKEIQKIVEIEHGEMPFEDLIRLLSAVEQSYTTGMDISIHVKVRK